MHVNPEKGNRISPPPLGTAEPLPSLIFSRELAFPSFLTPA